MSKANTHDAEFMFCSDVVYSVLLPDSKNNIYQVIQYDYATLKPVGIFYGTGPGSVKSNEIYDIRPGGDHIFIVHASLVIVRLAVTKNLINDIKEIDKNPVSKGEIIGNISDGILISSYGPACKTLKVGAMYFVYVFSDEDKQFNFSYSSKNPPGPFTRAEGHLYKYGEATVMTFPICPYSYDGNYIYSAENSSMKIKVGAIEYSSFIKYNGKWHIAVAPTDLHKFVSKSAAVMNASIALIELGD